MLLFESLLRLPFCSDRVGGWSLLSDCPAVLRLRQAGPQMRCRVANSICSLHFSLLAGRKAGIGKGSGYVWEVVTVRRVEL